MFISAANAADVSPTLLACLQSDKTAPERRRRIATIVSKRLPTILDAYHEQAARAAASEASASPARRGDDKALEIDFWENLLSGAFSAATAERARKVGEAYSRDGAGPDDIAAGCAFVLTKLVETVLSTYGAGKAADDLSALVAAGVWGAVRATAAAVQNGGEMRTEILTLSEMLEREATNTVGEIAFKAARFLQISRDVARGSAELQRIVESIENATHAVTEQIGAVAAATDQLRSLSEDIAARVQTSQDLSANAARHSQDAAGSVEGLKGSAERINDVVTLIRRIASQTRMLALNATIEAARAGEVGKGFAVVAQEVKALSGQTEASIARVSSQAQDIHDGAAEAAATMGSVKQAITTAEEASRIISGAAAEQRTAAADIASSVLNAAEKAREVAGHMHDVATQAHSNQQAASTLESLANLLDKDMAQLRERILRIVHSSKAKADHVRVPVAIKCQVDLNGARHVGMIVDLSLTGALVRLLDRPTTDDIAAGTVMRLRADGIDELSSRVLMPAGSAAHVQFTALSAAAQTALSKIIEDVRQRDAAMGALCADGARRLSASLENALRRNRISRDGLFSETYAPVPGTSPQQHEAPFSALTDELFTPEQEEMLTRAPGVVFCCAADRNGYIPTHNKKVSHPQRPDDPIWNAANCRNRRIFNDRAGLLAAKNREPVLTQTYDRDMGGGNLVFLKEVDCPIMVNGEHWGNLRMGFTA